MPSLEDLWHSHRQTKKEKIAFLFNNNEMSDVSFVVQASTEESETRKVIPAHKFVLAISSRVFHSMFYGPLPETKDSIELSDCEYESLLELFRYIYCDQANLSGSNVLQLWYLAKKYMTPELALSCKQFVQHAFQVKVSNVFCTLSCARMFEDTDLENRCWKVIEKQTERAVTSDEFATVERSVVESIVKKEVLNIKEVELFKAVDHWGVKECERRGITLGGKERRIILGEEIVKAIRFPLMSYEEFRSVTISRETENILKHEEISHMLSFYLDELKTPLQFSPAQRVDFHLCLRFDNFLPPLGDEKWNYGDKMGELAFSVDKTIYLLGIQLFGSFERYNVTVEVKRHHGDWITFTKHSGTHLSRKVALTNGYYYGFDVFFDDPILLETNRPYKIVWRIRGPSSWYGGGYKEFIECHGVVFTFIRHVPSLRGTVHYLNDLACPALLFRENISA